MLILHLGNALRANHGRVRCTTGKASGWKLVECLTIVEAIHIIRPGRDCDAGHHIGVPTEVRDREETQAGPENRLVVAKGPPCDTSAWIEIMIVRVAEP